MTDLAAKVKTVDMGREYVAGSVSSYQSSRLLRGLPFAFDDLTSDFGDDIYERMLLDPQVTATLNVLRAGIIEEGLRCECPVQDEEQDGYELGHEIAAFCTSVLDDLSTPLDDVLWDMLGCLAFGSRIAEEVWQLKEATSYSLPDGSPVSAGQELLVIGAIKVKPRRSAAFVVDSFMNVIGILGRSPDSGLGLPTSSVLSTNPKAIPNLLPRDKFAVLSFRPQDGDPRGSSVLRPAYTPWWTKQQVYPEFLKYLAQFASPSIYAIASEKATNEGVKITNDDGTTTIRAAVEVLLETLLAFQNGTALAVPYGTVLNAIEVSGNGEAFHNAFTHCDQQISVAVLHQTLATLEAQHQARASSEVHQDTLDTIVRQAKRAVCTMMHRDVLHPMVAYNYGPDAARALTPTCSLGSVERQDLPAMMTAIAQLARSGYLDPSQYAGIDAQLSLPARSMEEAEEPEEGDKEQEQDNQPPMDEGDMDEDDDEEEDADEQPL